MGVLIHKLMVALNTQNPDVAQHAHYCIYWDIYVHITHVILSTFHYSDPLSAPRLTVDRVTNSAVTYTVDRVEQIPAPLISGYEVVRFGVPMLGEYDNAGQVIISPVVPGTQYKIIAWSLGIGNRSEIPAVEYVTTEETSE